MATLGLLLVSLCLMAALQGDAIPLSPRLQLVKQSQMEFVKTSFLQSKLEKKASAHPSAWCTVCKLSVGLVQAALSVGEAQDQVASALQKLCIEFKIEDHTVCMGIIKEFQGEVLTIFDRLVLSPSEFCGAILGDSCGHYIAPRPGWNVTLPRTKKPPIKPILPPKPGSPITKVLQITDTHLDQQYMEGANTDCGEPLCCRKSNGPAPKGVTPAGKWGYFNCDTPLVMLDNLLQHINEVHKDLDYIIWTGDIPAHNVWNQTREDQMEAIAFGVKTLKKYFPNKKVYPCLGNHESAPVNSFPPPFIKGKQSDTWLLDALSRDWLNWLPSDTNATIERGGFYTTLIDKGFRLISLNMNFCNNQNWWLLLNNTDPAGQLQWLMGVLQSAEDNGEKVHIIGHIPPGVTTCVRHWSFNYYKIINRYESTVVAQFFAHTHHDEFEMFYDDKTFERPLGVAYIGPSVTPYTNINPGYRIYHIDGNYANSSRVVLDHETYIMDLEKANKKGVAEWVLEYKAKEAYNMTSLLPKDWDDLINRMYHDRELFLEFYKRVWKSHQTDTCDSGCQKGFLCRLKTGRSFDTPLFCKFDNDDEVNKFFEAQIAFEKC